MDKQPLDKSQPIKNYRDLMVWQQAIQLAKQIYLLTDHFPQKEVYGLTVQLRRAAVSIPSNIAEGQSRQYSKEFAHFLHIALGSLAELDTQLILSCELGYINESDLNNITPKLQEIRRMLYGLINRLPGR